MMRYTGTPDEECALASWWLDLRAEESLPTLLLPRARSLTGFLEHLSRCLVLFETDPRGMRVVVWGVPWLAGALAGVWVRRDQRGTVGAYRAACEGVAALLGEFPVLVALVTQARLLRGYRRLGWVFGAEPVPGWWDGRDTWVGHLTAAAWRPRLPSVAAVEGANHGGR